MSDSRSNDEKLAEMKPRDIETTWEDRGLELLDELKQEWRENPINMTCMVVFGAIVLGVLLYGASYIAPIYDPSYH